MSVSEIAPLFDPEILRTKGRGYAAYCNKISRKPFGKAIYQALELAEQAYQLHDLPYEQGIAVFYAPDRFTWFCDDHGDAKECVKLRDNQTGAIKVWPHWRG
jgi:hypothetical protein